MARIPIYQMTYGLSAEGNEGLVFSSELNENDIQSVLFSIPIVDTLRNYRGIFKYLESHTIYFPFLLGEKYFELEANINFPELVFKVPDTDFMIKFDIDFDNLNPRLLFNPPNRFLKSKVKYVGKTKIVIKNNGFLTLLPYDLYEMDELYMRHKGVFVGLTPNFGMTDSIYKQHDLQ